VKPDDYLKKALFRLRRDPEYFEPFLLDRTRPVSTVICSEMQPNDRMLRLA
jgi:hypothetical protein